MPALYRATSSMKTAEVFTKEVAPENTITHLYIQ
jgi:hypothetical protein